MVLHAFRGSEFDHTHENLAFNRLYDRLAARWKANDEHIYLVGNFFVNGHDIDALVIKKNSITIIEIKNFGGALEISENGRWLADTTEVKGGNSDNPYIQTRRNKFALLDYLEQKAELRSQPNLGHISGLALFHDDVSFNEDALPHKIRSWFHIADMKRAIRTIEAIASRSINLSQTEMRDIVDLLNVTAFDPDANYPPDVLSNDTPVYPKSDNRLAPTKAPERYYGIDLGTTYSLMAIVDEEAIDCKAPDNLPVQFVKFEQRSPNAYDSPIMDEKVASIIATLDGRYYAGNQLYRLKGDKRFKHGINMFYHCKLEMGVKEEPYYRQAADSKLDMPYKVAGVLMNFMRASHLKDKEKELKNTAITVPAGFFASQREDTIKAGSLANIEITDRMLIDEPSAAFLGYFNELPATDQKHWSSRIRNANLLVVDFGGGTLDLSLLNIGFDKRNGLQVGTKAISRYNDLGGQDFDNLIAEGFLLPLLSDQVPEVETVTFRELRESILPQLAVWAEKLKIKLSDLISLKAADKDAKSLSLDDIKVELGDCELSIAGETRKISTITMNGAEFEALFLKLFNGNTYRFEQFDKTITTVGAAISETIEKAQLKRTDIDFVLFAGGSSFNPLMHSYAGESLRNATPLKSSQPDKLVAAGAAVYSYFYHRHGISLLSSISSEEIGITLKGNEFYPIIRRGQELPHSVDLTDLKLQSQLAAEVIIPICLNDTAFEIGKLRASLSDKSLQTENVEVRATMTENKTLEIGLFSDETCLETGCFENPFIIGQLDKKRRALHDEKIALSDARRKSDNDAEKKHLRNLIWKNSAVRNKAAAATLAEEYIEKYDDNDAAVWNALYCASESLGRGEAANKALERAISITPDEPTYIYNKSLIIEEASKQKALDFLEQQPKIVRQDATIQIKIILLRHGLNKLDLYDAIAIAEDFKVNAYNYSDFDQRILLPQLHRIIKEEYHYSGEEDEILHDEHYLEHRGKG